jgi:hypothetical protein
MYQTRALPTGGKSWGHPGLHPINQIQAQYERKCLGIVKYLRMLHEVDAAKCKLAMLQFVQKMGRIRFQPCEGNFHQEPQATYSKRVAEATSKKHPYLINDMLHAMTKVIGPGGGQYKSDWEAAAFSLAAVTYARA